MPYLTEILAAIAGLVVGVLGALAFIGRRLAAAEEKSTRIPALESSLAQAQAENSALNARASALQAQAEQERKSAEEKLALVEQAEAKLTDVFKAVSSDVLRNNSQSFLELAKSSFATIHETAKGDLDKRQQAIGDLVKPLRESLDKVDQNIVEIEKSRASAYSALTEQLRSLAIVQTTLQTETTKLSTALSGTRTAGTWGELQLRRVVELAGMKEHCDFVEQETASGQRPDMVVKLPMGQQIVVDAKAPTEAFREAAVETDAKLRREKLLEHASKVRGHVDALGAKAYWEQFNPSPEFVVLFLPGDQFLAFALEADPGLMDRAITKNVLLVTPSTLIALLKAAAYGWRQEAVSQNAEEISKSGRDLYDRIAKLTEHFDNIQAGIEGAATAYNEAVGGLERMVLPGARRLKELGAGGSKEIKRLKNAGQPLRRVVASELRTTGDVRESSPDSKSE